MDSKDFFTSDLHIDHEGIISVCGRPYQNLDQMRRDYIKKFNSKLDKDSTLYVLGDAMMYKHPGVLYDFIHAIKCKRKILMFGNHDVLPWYKYIECGFEQVHSYLQYADNIHLIHDPSAACLDRKALWISGHLHSTPNFVYQENHFDCGVDGNNGFPWSLEEIKERIS